MLKSSIDRKIYVAGHRGMVGSAIIRELRSRGYSNIVTKTHLELDLTNQQKVADFFEKEKPDQVYLAAAKVGGIYANNTFPAEFIYQNLMIEANIIHQSFLNGVKKLLFLGSSCIYPKLAHQPIMESALLTGLLEPTNEPYAIAKIAGIKLCESYNRQYGTSHGVDFRSVMPTNLYGLGDSYHPENSHVIPAIIRKIYYANINCIKEVKIWGSGKPRREFLFSEDLASACLFVMNLPLELYRNEIGINGHINIGYGEDITISELTHKIAGILNYKGVITYDRSMPDGTPKKLLDSSRIFRLGWKPKVTLDKGLPIVISEFVNAQPF